MSVSPSTVASASTCEAEIVPQCDISNTNFECPEIKENARLRGVDCMCSNIVTQVFDPEFNTGGPVAPGTNCCLPMANQWPWGDDFATCDDYVNSGAQVRDLCPRSCAGVPVAAIPQNVR